MSRTRRHFADEFKRKAVRLVNVLINSVQLITLTIFDSGLKDRLQKCSSNAGRSNGFESFAPFPKAFEYPDSFG
jgi:hypothetical protein